MTRLRFNLSVAGILALLALTLPAILTGCGPSQEASGERTAPESVGSPEAGGEGPASQEARLGPVDGQDLPPTELNRVAVGTVAPDFTLRSLSERLYTLSDYRGSKDVILVFYRGHW